MNLVTWSHGFALNRLLFLENFLVHFKWVENIIGKKGILYVHSCLRDPHISYITIVAAHLRQSAMRWTLELKRKSCIL